jgi:hypothetical protein
MCMAPCHRLGGFVAGAALAAATHQPLWVAVASAGIATVAAAGRLSPDVDQFKGWRLADKLTPDEMLGKGGPGLWIAWAALAGWVSHLLLDWAFGQADPWAHRGPGIPVWPWWGHVGLGLDAGGLLERFVLTPALVVAGAVVLAWPYAAPFVRTATTAWEATR